MQKKTIERCVRSIQSNNEFPIEIIIVNDGSRDRTVEICNILAQEDSRIHVINKENGGVGAARNAGIEIAQGRYITFVDADDEVSQNMYAHLLRTAQQADADVVVCNLELVFNNRTEPASHSYADQLIVGNKNVYSQIIVPMTVTRSPDPIWLPNVWNKIYKSSKLHTHNIRFSHISHAEDWLFNIEYFLHAERVAFISDHLYQYYQTNSGSLSKTRSLNRYAHEAWLEKRMAELFPERYSKEDALRGILGLQISELQSFAFISGWKGFLKYADCIFRNEDLHIAYHTVNPLAKKYRFPKMCILHEWRLGYLIWGIWLSKLHFIKHILYVPYRAVKRFFR